MRSNSIIGQTIGGYAVTELLGQGGMGSVYLAQHPSLGKKIAIKHLKPELSQDATALHRFFQEAKVVNHILHENLIDIFDLVQTESGPCILMEYLEGRSLSALIRQEAPLPAPRIGHIALQLCAALLAAHEKGVIHRDLKPDNVMLTKRAGKEDFVKVLDFGLARLQERSLALSVPGIALGTPAYMSPEQAEADTVDARADIYSLGVILYEMATKTLPFFSTDPGALLRKQMLEAPPTPSARAAGVDPQLEAVILRCLEKEPDARYASMYELALAISQACRLDIAPYFGAALLSSRGIDRTSQIKLEEPITKVTPRQEQPTEALPTTLLTPKRGSPGRLPVAALLLALFVGLGFSLTSSTKKEAEPPKSIAASLTSEANKEPQAKPEPHQTEPQGTPQSDPTTPPKTIVKEQKTTKLPKEKPTTPLQRDSHGIVVLP